MFLRPRLRVPGELFWMVAGGYAAGRLVLQSTREPRPGARRVTIDHGISPVLIVFIGSATDEEVLNLSCLTGRFGRNGIQIASRQPDVDGRPRGRSGGVL
jgi:hypothetical protein